MLLMSKVLILLICLLGCSIAIGDNDLLDKSIIIPETIRKESKFSKTLLKECTASCTVDNDCKEGLLCALPHKKELRSLQYDSSRAYCPKVKRPYRYVCYDPKKVIAKNTETNTECPIIPIDNAKCDKKIFQSDTSSCTVGPKYCCPKLKERYDDKGKLICGGTLNPSSCYYTRFCQCVRLALDFPTTWACSYADIQCLDPMSCYN